MKKILDSGDESLYLPCYSYNNGVPGLTLAIDSWLGDKIEIVRYETDEETYSAVLRITFYDHFGLDTSDLSDKKYGSLTAGMLPGFRQWFIIQHWASWKQLFSQSRLLRSFQLTLQLEGAYEL